MPMRMMWQCPVDGCAWQHDLTPETASPLRWVLPIGHPIGEALTEAVTIEANRRSAQTETILREHLSSHDLLDFVRTLRRLECDLYQQRSGIRPHAYPGSPERVAEWDKHWRAFADGIEQANTKQARWRDFLGLPPRARRRD